MNPSRNDQCHQTQELISGYLDQELTQQKNQMVRVHLESCKECNAIYQDLKAMKETIGNLQYPDCEATKMEKILQEPVAKKISILGWILLTIPLAILFIYHIVTIFTVGSFSLFSMKTIILLLEAGVLLLFIGVLRQRLIARKSDKYKNVKL
ncbi:MAG: zf-HC2 domain-containing protein [Gammaproteobacteria bacterium]|nr:zf-HC2 domain-containing protein [Gammaproteobacteria bacterium]